MFFYKIFCVICYIDSFLDLPQCNIIDILCFSSYVVSNYGPKRNKKKKIHFRSNVSIRLDFDFHQGHCGCSSYNNIATELE